jgi:hypothetical protein
MLFEFYLFTFSISIGLVFYSIITETREENDRDDLPEFDYNSDTDPEYTNQNYYRHRVFDSDDSSLYD